VNTGSHKNLLLKFKGKDSFLYGDTQLVYFEEIRQHLRTKDAPVLAIELIRAKKHTRSSPDMIFPPIAKTNKPLIDRRNTILPVSAIQKMENSHADSIEEQIGKLY
jgi:hypothetical protein